MHLYKFQTRHKASTTFLIVLVLAKTFALAQFKPYTILGPCRKQ